MAKKKKEHTDEKKNTSEDELIDLSEATEELTSATEELTASALDEEAAEVSAFTENEIAADDLEDDCMLSELEADSDDDALSEFKDYDSLEEEYPEDEIYAEGEESDASGILTPKERRLMGMTLEARVEAILFASQKPLKAAELLEILGDDTLELEHIEKTLKDIAEFYANRAGGFRLHYLKRLGFQFQTSDNAGAIMERMFASRPRPISRAALETLAIIAYRQPVTRAEVEFIRGVDAGSIFKTLLERDLIKCTGRKEIVGRPMLFGTSDDYVKVFNLSSIKDLPPLEAFQPSREVVQGAMERISEGPDDLVDIEQYIADNAGGEEEPSSEVDEEVGAIEAQSESSEDLAVESADTDGTDERDETDDALALLESVADRTFGASKNSGASAESAPEDSSPAEDIDGTDKDTEMALSDGDSVPERSGDLDQ